MFIKDKNSNESYIHVCEGKTEKRMRNNKLEIRRHDVTHFTLVHDETGKVELEHIKYCPYCGCDLEKDTETNRG